MINVICKGCGKRPEELGEYIQAGKEWGITPTAYVRSEEGTYNKATGKFYCDTCYIRAGMPLGEA